MDIYVLLALQKILSRLVRGWYASLYFSSFKHTPVTELICQ